MDEKACPDGVAAALALGPVPLSGASIVEASGAMWATAKEKLSPPAPAITTAVCTVTRSPGTKATRGLQIVYPAGSATRLPACTPLREPVTRTVPSAAGVIPRKLIVVCGVANRSPGEGETATGLASEAAAPAAPAVHDIGPAGPATKATATAAVPA
jgi:hypothetical protein